MMSIEMELRVIPTNIVLLRGRFVLIVLLRYHKNANIPYERYGSNTVFGKVMVRLLRRSRDVDIIETRTVRNAMLYKDAAEQYSNIKTSNL
jgi:hypothetical protein